jgi:hypothetical protein
MPSDQSLLERRIERVELRPFTLEGFHRRRQRRERNRRIGAAVVALAVAAAGIGGVARAFLWGAETRPAEQPTSPFLGTWSSTDLDGSTQTMVVRASGDEAVEIAVRDDSASVCSGAPSTMTGTGRLEGATELVIPSPVLTCVDGSEPEALSGPPLEEQLRNLTFVHDPGADTLTDNLGSVWNRRETTQASGGMWPQSDLDEVREAQERADAGDPRYTWQVDPKLAAGDARPYEAEIFARFLREELGWQEFRGAPVATDAYWRGFYDGVVFIRCAPGRTNPLYPNDPQGRGCAPTIDELRYETVAITVKQLVREDPSGIWVVTGWEMPPPSDEGQFEQVVPPTDAEVTGLLEAFLQARIDGEGAEEYLHSPGDEVPLLYATSSGAPYERFEIERVGRVHWPGGWLRIEVRLFAEGGNTVVEQGFFVDDADGRLELLDTYGDTTENGQAVPVPYSFLDGEVTFAAAPRWACSECGPDFSDHGSTYMQLRLPPDSDGSFNITADPLPVEPLPETGCEPGPAPADAEALARSIRSKPYFEVTAPVAVSVGGIDALRMDVVGPARSICHDGTIPQVTTGHWLPPGERMRLYVLDLPEGMSARILTIAILAPKQDFEHVVEAAAPILDSFEFHAK